ncbi:MAG: VTT domain-containing protein [Chloroflexi bacterium]|nr:VTT domain-containing protein [Chloroflexota bacterium]
MPFPLVMQGLLVFAGYQMTQGDSLSVVPLLCVAFLGSVSGSNAIYWASRFAGGRLFMSPRFRGIFKHRWLLRAQGIAEKQRPLAIATGRLLPGMLIPVSIAAGVLKVPWSRFTVGVALSEIIWVVPLVVIGVVAGHTARGLDWTTNTYPKAITLIVVAIGLYFVARLLWSRLRTHFSSLRNIL